MNAHQRLAIGVTFLLPGGCRTAPSARPSPDTPASPAREAAAAARTAPSAERLQEMRRRFVGRRPQLDSMRRWPADLGLDWEPFAATNPLGMRIAGWWLPAASPAATVVMVHGGGQNKSFMLDRAAVLVGEGYDVALIDLRARGESGGNETNIGPGAAVDVIAAVEALDAAGRLRDAPLIAYGFSHGARTVLFGAARSPRFAAVIAEAPPFSLAAGLQREMRLATPLVLPEGDLPGAVAALRDRPVLLMLGDSDPELSESQARALLGDAANAASDIVVFQDTGHGVFTTANRARFRSVVSLFLRRATGR